MQTNDKISINSVKEAMRMRDTEMIFKEYAEGKCKYYAEFIDIDTINAF